MILYGPVIFIFSKIYIQLPFGEVWALIKPTALFIVKRFVPNLANQAREVNGHASHLIMFFYTNDDIICPVNLYIVYTSLFYIDQTTTNLLIF
jgi:hypothetical protein